MAALVVQSRFAGLQIEDDDYSGEEDQKSKKIKANVALSKKIDAAKKTKNNNNKSQTNTKKRKQKPNATTDQQWELWKQKDEQLVDGNFETELQEAILLSKLDYEEKKDVYKQFKKEAEVEKKLEPNRAGNSKKIKKKNVMSLDQFNDMVNAPNEINNIQEVHDKKSNEESSVEKDTRFFDRVQDETKHELIKDRIITRVKHEVVPDEVINKAQFAVALEKKDEEIAALRLEVTNLKKELLTVKSRNKKLCNILGQGEMRDKAEVLMEVEKLRSVQAELTAELAILHEDLERERSKNADTRTKDKKKRGGTADKEK